MATVVNTITLRDRMSGIVDRITRGLRNMGNQSERSGQQAERGMRGLAQQGQAAASVMSRLGSGIVVANQAIQLFSSTMSGLGNITNVVDQYTSIEARLGNIVSKGETVAEMQNKIYDAAERSHGSYKEMASSVAKMSLLAQDAFKGNNDEVIAFTESLQKSFAISGASTQEQQAGIYQITQALAAGKLQGDEFRSVMENAPMFAQAISKYTGKTMGELKKMSAAGTISGSIMKNAMFAAADEINKKFAAMPMTFAGAWQIAKDKALRAMEPFMKRMSEWLNTGGAEQITKLFNDAAYAAKVLAESLFWIVDHSRGVTATFVALAIPLAVLKVAMIVFTIATNAATMATLRFTASLLTNPIGWVILLIGAAIGAIYYWAQSVGGFKIAWAIVMDYILFAMDITALGIMTGVYQIMDAFDMCRIAVRNTMMKMSEGVLTYFSNMINTVIGYINNLIDAYNFIQGKAKGTGTIEWKADFSDAGLSAANMEDKADMYLRQNRLANMKDMMKGDRAKRQADIGAAKAAKDGADKPEGPPEMNVPKGTPNDPISTKEKGDISISEEDLKYMRDLARVKFINKFTTLRPAVNATFGDVRETADINAIVSHIASVIEESTAGALG